MVQALREGALTQTKGVVKYRPEFALVSSEEETIMPAQHDPLTLLSTPYKALPVRGTMEIETINGIVPAYELCAKRY